MRNFGTVLLFLFSSSTFATVTSMEKIPKPFDQRWSLGAGLESRMLRKVSSSQDFDSQLFPSVHFTYREKWFQTLGELAWFSDQDGQGDLRVAYSRQEYRQWARFLVQSQRSWTPHMGLSLGVYQEQIETSFQNDFRKDKSDIKPTGGIEFGIQGLFYSRLHSGANFRFLQDISPDHEEWSWSLQLHLGFSPL